MAVMDVCNDSTGWLILWLEPLGEDRWLRPSERVRIRTDYRGDDLAFSVTTWVDQRDRADGIENIAVCVENGDCRAEVTDANGAVVECGHQRPERIAKRWQAEREAMPKSAAAQTSPESL
ncbi:hypothetical protein GPX89_14655 [Nocardia sp. ET3-3]|uniref:Uncharacterized protein n=1 Tax=Nocardia terrae TaxID=2675851 RepID=A0A7K1UW18_9NOCA|nr:hypothetical protein [Nocardia terrae]MVU78482.1 hypothetical protein [Nocardia terrae]